MILEFFDHPFGSFERCEVGMDHKRILENELPLLPSGLGGRGADLENQDDEA
jgi:hypothetical protein